MQVVYNNYISKKLENSILLYSTKFYFVCLISLPPWKEEIFMGKNSISPIAFIHYEMHNLTSKVHFSDTKRILYLLIHIKDLASK